MDAAHRGALDSYCIAAILEDWDHGMEERMRISARDAFDRGESY